MIRKQIMLLTALVLIGASSFFSRPELLQAAECSGTRGNLCEELHYCWNVLFASMCITSYEYYEGGEDYCRLCHVG